MIEELLKQELIYGGQNSSLFGGAKNYFLHHYTNKFFKTHTIWFGGFLFLHFVAHSWSVPTMEITQCSHLFKWDNLENWWPTQYFLCPTICFNFNLQRTQKQIVIKTIDKVSVSCKFWISCVKACIDFLLNHGVCIYQENNI